LLESEGVESDDSGFASIFDSDDSIDEKKEPIALGKRSYVNQFGAKDGD